MTEVRYSSQEIAVLLSEGHIQEWSGANQAGVYSSVDIGPEGLLNLIVEKDFACLDRSDEENQDTFANPHANENCPKTDDVESHLQAVLELATNAEVYDRARAACVGYQYRFYDRSYGLTAVLKKALAAFI